MHVQVRHAVPEDAAAIAAVHVSSWQVAYRGLVPDELLDQLSVAQRETVWRDALTAERPPAVLVATSDGVLIGFCAIGTPSRDADADGQVAEIGAIYVDPDMWRRGVGRALLKAALAHLRAADWRTVTLWVAAENRRARDFYAQFGLEPDGAEMTDEHTGLPEVRLRVALTP